MNNNVWSSLQIHGADQNSSEIQSFNITSDLCYIGNAEGCHIRVPDNEIADQHCFVMRDPEGQAWLVNLCPNKTRIHESCVLDDPVLLHNGDTFYLCADESSDSRKIGLTFTYKDKLCESPTPFGDSKEQAEENPEPTVETSENSASAGDTSTSCSQKTDPKKHTVTTSQIDIALMENNLTCIICSNIFFECCSLQPCLHSFCTLCWLQWLSVRNICPVCRVPVQSYAKNHQLDALADLFTVQNPDKGRNDQEKAKIKEEINELKQRLDPILQSSASRSVVPTPSGCPICGFVFPNPASNSSSPCGPHDICACCQCPVPAFVRTQSATNQVQCEICCRTFCSLINTAGCRNCLGDCLSRFSDLCNMNVLPADLLLRNTVETSILKNYLAQKEIPVSTFIQSCLQQMDSNLFGLNGPTDQSPVCRDCALRYLSELAYQERAAIPNDELPVTVTSRPDCHYGRHCRTQRTKLSHAHRYNHICDQKRY